MPTATTPWAGPRYAARCSRSPTSSSSAPATRPRATRPAGWIHWLSNAYFKKNAMPSVSTSAPTRLSHVPPSRCSRLLHCAGGRVPLPPDPPVRVACCTGVASAGSCSRAVGCTVLDSTGMGCAGSVVLGGRTGSGGRAVARVRSVRSFSRSSRRSSSSRTRRRSVRDRTSAASGPTTTRRTSRAIIASIATPRADHAAPRDPGLGDSRRATQS